MQPPESPPHASRTPRAVQPGELTVSSQQLRFAAHRLPAKLQTQALAPKSLNRETGCGPTRGGRVRKQCLAYRAMFQTSQLAASRQQMQADGAQQVSARSAAVRPACRNTQTRHARLRQCSFAQRRVRLCPGRQRTTRGQRNRRAQQRAAPDTLASVQPASWRTTAPDGGSSCAGAAKASSAGESGPL